MINVKLGDSVIAENVDGSTLSGVVVNIEDKPISEIEVEFVDYADTLFRYWEKESDADIDPQEGAIVVDNGDRAYTYPQSQVQKETQEEQEKEEVQKTDPELLQECPQCGDTFAPSRNSTVESLDGELYCSIECLNESLL